MPIMSRRAAIQSLSIASVAPMLVAQEATTQKVVTTRPGENRFEYVVPALRTDAACKLTANDSSGTCSIFELSTPSRGGPPKHIHHREDEWYYVLQGEFLFDVGGIQHKLPVGGTVFAPRGIAHVWANIAKTTGKMLLLCQPGGFEHFFDVFGRGLEAGISAEKMERIMEDYGMEMLGPPMFAAAVYK